VPVSQQIVSQLVEKGVALKATKQPVDTSTAAGKCFLGTLSVFAAFETKILGERRMEGSTIKKEEGK